jgi:hypothetical protein
MFSLDNKAALPAVLLVSLWSAQAQKLDTCLQPRVTVNVRDRQGKFVGGLQVRPDAKNERPCSILSRTQSACSTRRSPGTPFTS